MTPGIGWIPDDHFLERVKRAYRASVKSPSVFSRFSIWGKILERQKDVHSALMDDNHDTLRTIFSNPASTDLFYGVDNLCRTVLNSGISEVGLAHQSRDICSTLPVANFSFPNPFAGEMGCETSNGVISYRAALAVSQALKIKEILGSSGRILEVGPGLGRTALHARQLGISDYTTVDLPMGLVSQACFLGATIGPDAIWFSTDDISPVGRVRVMTSLQPRFYDLVLNVDSIVEMPPLTAIRYAMWIRTHARKFLSINYDYRRMKIKYLAALCFPFIETEQRDYPLRRGYKEDIFIFS